MIILNNIRLCPHENGFSHLNRFHPDLLYSNKCCKSMLELCWFSRASALSKRVNRSVRNRFHPEQLQSGLDETDLHAVYSGIQTTFRPGSVLCGHGLSYISMDVAKCYEPEIAIFSFCVSYIIVFWSLLNQSFAQLKTQ